MRSWPVAQCWMPRLFCPGFQSVLILFYMEALERVPLQSHIRWVHQTERQAGMNAIS